MAQDIEPKVVWRHTLFITVLMLFAFLGIDTLHFILFGTKFTYLLNPASSTSVIDFFFYLITFAGMGFLVGFLPSGCFIYRVSFYSLYSLSRSSWPQASLGMPSVK